MTFSMSKHLFVGSVGCAAILLAGCNSSNFSPVAVRITSDATPKLTETPTATPTQIPTETVTVTARPTKTSATTRSNVFTNINDLKAAFERAGGSCPYWNQTNVVSAALESGDCDDNTVLSIYKNAFAAESAAKNLADTYRGFGLSPTIAYGPNWVINGKQAEKVAARMGGALITF